MEIMKGIIPIIFMYCIKTIFTQVPCEHYPLPGDIYFNETTTAGTIIFISNETSSATQEWFFDSSSHFSLMFENRTYMVNLKTAIDLDVANTADSCNVALYESNLDVTCKRADGQEPVVNTLKFTVVPVNEYSPDVTEVPPVRITEGNVPLPFYLSRLFDYFKDRDCPKEDLLLSISKYSSTEIDASEYFTINSTTGYLYQTKRFDFENTTIQCGIGKGGGFLNITAEDGLHQISKTISVTFVNVDDTPPVFVNGECSSTCYTCPVSVLNVVVPFSHEGVVVTEPASIKALDPDTNPSNITYSMQVNPAKYADNIEFDNGTLVLLQSFANFSGYTEESSFTVTVTLQATGSNNQTSDNLTLSINVEVPPTTTPAPTTTTTQPTTTTTTMTTTTTTTPSTTTPTVTSTTAAPTTTPTNEGNSNSDASSGDNKRVLIIVLCVIGAVVVIVLIIILYKVRMRQPNHKYKLKEKNAINGTTTANGGSAPEKEMTQDNPAFEGGNDGV